MLYQGQAIKCQEIGDGIVELQFDLQGESINKLNRVALDELRQTVNLLREKSASIRGLLVTSAKDSFIVGADITEFLGYFDLPPEELTNWVKGANQIFSDLEDLPFPSITAINGYALGGGFEMPLSTDYRLASTQAKVGLPETKLGIFPGFGGTVRLSRVAGADNAIEWIASGKENKADEALKIGAVDGVVAPEKLRDAAIATLKQAIAGKLNWKAKRQEKLSPLKLDEIERMMAFEGAKAFVAGQAGPHYPAPVEAIKAIQNGAEVGRDEALAIECKHFVKMAKTPVAKNLVGLFLGDQYLKHEAKKYQKIASPVKSAAVLGAGIMGGGIAYQSAYKGTPIYMKDINAKALDQGLAEASKLLSGQVSRGRMDAGKMAGVLSNIRATLAYDDMKNVDIIVEAVVENPKVKKAVLVELEGVVRPDTVLTSNTSTISISLLADGLKNPERFCGMHFFNPVHKMPLVEVIRGKQSDERAIATTVAYASAMGKTPIVVNDCPGFLVNRILFPYFQGFLLMLNEGVEFQRIDKVMEKFGWPMGPAYLLDVVGIDTAHHAGQVMAEGYPDRMKSEVKTAVHVMFENQRFGQKNDKGFYNYSLDKKGKPVKAQASEVPALLQTLVKSQNAGITDEEIVERMMIPMIIESARCLEDNIVQQPAEVDMGLIYGLGFPPFLGGALKYADSLGLAALCEKAAKYAPLGKIYEPTAPMRELAKAGKTFYSK